MTRWRIELEVEADDVAGVLEAAHAAGKIHSAFFEPSEKPKGLFARTVPMAGEPLGRGRAGGAGSPGG